MLFVLGKERPLTFFPDYAFPTTACHFPNCTQGPWHKTNKKTNSHRIIYQITHTERRSTTDANALDPSNESEDERFFRVFSRARGRKGRQIREDRPPVRSEPQTSSRRGGVNPAPSVTADGQQDGSETPDNDTNASTEESQEEDQDEIPGSGYEYGPNENSEEEDMVEEAAGNFGE